MHTPPSPLDAVPCMRCTPSPFSTTDARGYALPADTSHAYTHSSSPNPAPAFSPRRADATWPPSSTAANWISDTGKGLARHRPQEPTSRRNGGLAVSRYAAVAALSHFLLQFSRGFGRRGQHVSAAVRDWFPLQDGTHPTAAMRPARSLPALCFLPLRAYAGPYRARVGGEGLHDSSGRYLSGLI